MDLLYLHMNSIAQVSESSYKDFKSICTEKTYPKNHMLIDFGDLSNKIHFMLDGVARTYLINSNGKEINKRFAQKGDLIAASESNFYKTPSNIACQCLTKVKLVEASYDAIQQMCIKHKDIGYFQYRAIQYNYARLENRVIDLLSYPPKERYLKFKEEEATLEFLVEIHHIASYLGISTEELKNIKSSITQNIL